MGCKREPDFLWRLYSVLMHKVLTLTAWGDYDECAASGHGSEQTSCCNACMGTSTISDHLESLQMIKTN
jgi:hypothetical protein